MYRFGPFRSSRLSSTATFKTPKVRYSQESFPPFFPTQSTISTLPSPSLNHLLTLLIFLTHSPPLQTLRVILISNLAARPARARSAPAVANTAALAVLGDRASRRACGLAAGGGGAGLCGDHGRGLEGSGVGRGAAAVAAAGAAASELGGAGHGVVVEV